MYILIVEDNKTIADNEKLFLETDSHTVDVAYTGSEGLQLALQNNYDAIVLDIMLPEIDGITLCAEIRKKKNTPIIMTTAKGELEDKTDGFTQGADDYLVKPFSLEELSLRLGAITKRVEKKDVYRFGDIEIYPAQQRIVKQGEDIKFSHKEYTIVEYLASHKGQVVSRAELVDYIRGGEIWENDGVLDVYIANIRKKIGKDSIETIKGFGYKVE